MDLRPYLEMINSQLMVSAQAGGDEARAVAERLAAPLESAIRLALQDVLAAAVEEITLELAPGSVELRLRGRDPEFVVTPSPAAAYDEQAGGAEHRQEWTPSIAGLLPGDEGEVARVNLRLPDHLKARVESAAASEALSINSWLVRAVARALDRSDPAHARRAATGGQRYTGWAR
jgi:hypothetical protein